MKKSIVLTMVLVLLVGVFSFSFADHQISIGQRMANSLQEAQEDLYPLYSSTIHGKFMSYSFEPNDNGQLITVLKLVDNFYNEYEFYYHIELDQLQEWVMYDYYFNFDNLGEVESIQVVDGDILICDN